MRVSPVVVLLKFLPIAITVVNVATAFVFIHSCRPFLQHDSHYVMVNCTRAMVLNGRKHEVKGEFILMLISYPISSSA